LVKRKISSGGGFAFLAIIPVSLLSVAACSTTAPIAPPNHSDMGMCTADQVGQFIGQPATGELGADIQRATGAKVFRWLPRGTVVTMEYRGDRANAFLDEQNKVERVTCS
jgi:hypothetical protein